MRRRVLSAAVLLFGACQRLQRGHVLLYVQHDRVRHLHDPDLRRAERSGSVLPHHDRRHGSARPDPDDAVLPLRPRR